MLNLTDEECRDILCTALEGGSVYWMNDGYKVQVHRQTANDISPGGAAEYAGFTIKTDDEEQPIRGVIGLGDIARAAEEIISGNFVGSHIKGDVAGERAGCDAGSADAIVQLAVFGGLVYG